LFFQESFTFFNCAPPAAGEEISLAIACSQGVNIRPQKVVPSRRVFLLGCRNQQLLPSLLFVFISIKWQKSLLFSSSKQTVLRNATKALLHRNQHFLGDVENEPQ